MSKFSHLKIATALVALSVTGAANAEIFQYDTTFGGSQTRLTINTQAGTASYVGGGTNVTFSGANFSSFTGIQTNEQFFFSSVTGVVNDRGRVFTPYVDDNSGQPRLRFRNNGQSEIWSAAFNEDGALRNFDIDSGPLGDPIAPPPPAPPAGGSTSTGGLTSTGGVTGSTGGNVGGGNVGGGNTGAPGGGTDVPAPGILGLLGLGIAGLAFGRRRKNIK